MAVCFFSGDYETKYDCDYEIENDKVKVIVDYDISEEIKPDSNGVICFSRNTEFERRDILIVDYENKKNLLLKEAYYGGHTNVFGTPDGSNRTCFFSSIYFYHGNIEKLCDLPKTPKVKKIKIYSNAINNFIGCPSLTLIESEDEYSIKLKRESQTREIIIGKNYINKIVIGDCWNSKHSFNEYNIDVKLNGYIEIELTRRFNYDKACDFVYELIIFMQLLYPNKFDISKINVMVDNVYYGLFFPLKEMKIDSKPIEPTVNDDILLFLEKCYSLIPYRNSKAEIRNIPYIILNTYRGIEDNFLMFYRFIECYYKKKGIVNEFINYSIKNNFSNSRTMTEDEIEMLSEQIVSLRNKYVHSGYYIKNNSLKIKFKDIDESTPNPKNYTDNNVDWEWIFNKAEVLYEAVINIIFSDMLNYSDYNFGKKFYN